MRYVVSGEFTKISETTGTIQNMSNVYAVEVSNKAEADSGIILYPLNRISVTLSECYLRCVDGGNAEVRVVPFEVDVTRGGGSSAAGTSNLTDVFRSLEVIDGKVNFYGTTDKSGDILASFNLPEEIFLNQVGTIVVHDFMFSALAYPNSTNPNLDGKTVLVLAVKGDKKTNPTIKYVFVDLQKLVDKYLASNKSININGYSIAVNISDDTKNLLALKEDGLFVGSDDSKLDKVPSAVQDNIPVFDVEGTIIDGGLSFADLEYELPTASVTTKGGVKVGSGLAITGDTLSVTIQPETYTLPTASTSTKGGVKIGTGLTMDGDTLSVTLQGGAPSSGGTVGVLDTVPATVDGGLWYEVTDGVPSLWIRKGNYGYGFNYDRLNFAGDTSSGLVAYLPFTNNFADACGNKWSSGVNPEYSANIEVLVKPTIVDGSLYVDGRSWLVNDSISSSIGALPWTVDFWGNFSSGSGFWGTFNTLYPSGTNQWVGMKWNGGTVAMHFYGNDPPGSITVQENTRHHYAMTYDGTIVRMFVDGVLSLSLEHQISLGGDFLIGAAAGKEPSKGYIDHFRIHKGVALWTENFTSPTAADYL